ncbi:MAG: cellulase family glycosylhydrolase [Bacteroidetes bacterium]|nr:cellulase family glycosylhydrolase [Bacteroidota bacterium]
MTLIKRTLQVCFILLLFVTAHAQDTTRIRGMMIPTNASADDIRTLAAWGANHVRWQLTWGGGFPKSKADDATYQQYSDWLNSALDHMNSLLPLCKELGMKVIIDMHTLPGGYHNNNHRLFAEKIWQDNYINTWKDLAMRYKDNPTIYGYDIANEPQDGIIKDGAVGWPTLASMAAHEIRAIDKTHYIIVEARGGNVGSLAGFQPIDVPGIIYSFHMYEPHSITHQNIFSKRRPTPYPGRVGLKYWDRDRVFSVLQQIKDWQNKYNVPVYVGEFSCIRWAPGESAYNYLKDCIDFFEQAGWGWAYHAFREYDGWSVEHSGDKDDPNRTSEPTSRQKLLMEWFSKNTRF